MKSTVVLLLIILCAFPAFAQRHEIGFTVGAMDPRLDEVPSGVFGEAGLKTSSSFAFQVDYSLRAFNAKIAALYVDAPLALTPKTKFETSDVFFLRSYSSLFFTPGIKIKLLPSAKISPYAVAGYGVARLNPSDTRINGTPSGGRNAKVDDAYSVGGGVDVKAAKFLSLRGEIRDYNTGTPAFETNLFQKRQHNLFFTGGVVLRF